MDVELQLDSANQERAFDDVFTTKVFNDPVHGHIELPYLAVRIIDTSQFQRLRNIRQLGTTNYVYHGASHSRFEHSIGVCHLAGELVRLLMIKQPELEISKEDALCVQIAGLCHDLGHGPFSHTFECFVNKMRPERAWRHEEASVRMLEHLIEANDLIPSFRQCNLNLNDIGFIKYLIDPCKLEVNLNTQYPNKCFLAEIVCNRYSGMDVDKWDYFARDCFYLNLGTLFDYRRFSKYARVIDVNGELHVGTREKEVNAINGLYITRTMLHRRAYQHPIAKAIEIMLIDALAIANEHFLLNANGKQFRITEAVDAMEAFELLDDRILYFIRLSVEPQLKPAQQLLEQIDRRKLYQFVGIAIAKDKVFWRPCQSEWATSDSQIAKEMWDLPQSAKDEFVDIKDIFIEVYEIKCGPVDVDPRKMMFFYNKRQNDRYVPLRSGEDYCLSTFVKSEQHIIVFCRHSAQVLMACKRFRMWCSQHGFVVLKLNSRSIGTEGRHDITEQV